MGSIFYPSVTIMANTVIAAKCVYTDHVLSSTGMVPLSTFITICTECNIVPVIIDIGHLEYYIGRLFKLKYITLLGLCSFSIPMESHT